MNTSMYEDHSIFQIEVDRIDPHPLNPRKNLGDLTELKASIKKSGIMQNLTVVPKDDEERRYTVVIGHRRLAAAKLLKLETVPCVIRNDMDEKEQVATMIAENMQRNDLTITEQAGAVQLMLDFGDDYATIAERTGLSESTVRRRARLNQFDKKAVEAAIKRGASLLDFEKLDEIEDKEERVGMLRYIGTNNFKWEYERAIEKQKVAKVRDDLLAKISAWADRVDRPDYRTMHWFACYFFLNDYAKFEQSPDPERKFYFTMDSSGPQDRIYLYREDIKSQIEPRLNKEEIQRIDRVNKLDKLIKRIAEMRQHYFEECCFSKLKVKTLLATIILSEVLDRQDLEDDISMLGIDAKDSADQSEDESYYHAKKFCETIRSADEKDLIEYAKKLIVERSIEPNTAHYSYTGEYMNVWDNVVQMTIMKMIGYEPSDEEKAYFDGSHEAFLKPEQEKGGE